MFEAVLSHNEITVKNSPIFNADGLKTKRFNRTTYVVDGSIELNVDGGYDDWDGQCIVYRKMGNEYKLLPYKLGPTNICGLLKDEKMFYPEIVAHGENFPPVGTCDFKTGTLILKDYLPDLSKVPPVFESGDYQLECNVIKGKEIIQGLKFFGQVYNIKDAGKSKVGSVPGKPKI